MGGFCHQVVAIGCVYDTIRRDLPYCNGAWVLEIATIANGEQYTTHPECMISQLMNKGDDVEFWCKFIDVLGHEIHDMCIYSDDKLSYCGDKLIVRP